MKVLENLFFKLPVMDKAVTVDLQLAHYENGRIALELTTKEKGYDEPYTRVTVNLVDEDCPDDEVWVKNWSENTGMVDWLVKQKIIEATPTDNAQTGYVQAMRFKLAPEFLAAVEQALIRDGVRSRR